MKILCTGCGQRFDELLCGGICPYCGRYNDPAAQPAEKGAAGPAWQPPEPEEPGAGAGPIYKGGAMPPARPRPAHPNAVPGALCALLALVLAAELLAFPLAARAARAAKNSKGFVSAADTQLVQPGEAFPFGPLGRQVTVGDAQRVEGLAGAAAGTQVVRVWCETKKQKDYSNWQAEAYLQVGDVYYAPVDEYRMEAVYPELAAQMLDPYELSSTSMAEGWIYFAVPESAGQGTLWLQAQAMGADYRPAAVEMTGVPVAFEQGGQGDEG